MFEQLLISSGLYHSLAPNPKTKIGDAIWDFMASDKKSLCTQWAHTFLSKLQPGFRCPRNSLVWTESWGKAVSSQLSSQAHIFGVVCSLPIRRHQRNSKIPEANTALKEDTAFDSFFYLRNICGMPAICQTAF